MDREIPKQKLQQRQRRRILLGGAFVALAVGAVMIVGRFAEESVNISDIRLATADRGDIDAAINGNGSVVPAFEEVIVSPVNSRILEVYHHSGDIVDAGTPLLKLDLGEAATREAAERDELAMMRLDLQRLQASHRTRLSDLRMQVKVAEMKLRRQEVELSNERYLDSIGSGTTDRVREAQLALSTQRLELEQLREQLANEQRMLAAENDAKLLEISIKENNLALTSQVLADAEIRAPRRATVTSISDRLGTTVSQGQQVAVISDLGHYRIDASITESNAQMIKPGSRAHIIYGRNHTEGFVSTVAPTSTNGMVEIKVTLDNDSLPSLRPGVKTDIKISNGVKNDVVRIPNLPFYTGPNTYTLYVLPVGAEHLERRSVNLGSAGYDHIEVISGLLPGEEIVTSSTAMFGNAKRVNIDR